MSNEIGTRNATNFRVVITTLSVISLVSFVMGALSIPSNFRAIIRAISEQFQSVYESLSSAYGETSMRLSSSIDDFK